MIYILMSVPIGLLVVGGLFVLPLILKEGCKIPIPIGFMMVLVSVVISIYMSGNILKQTKRECRLKDACFIDVIQLKKGF